MHVLITTTRKQQREKTMTPSLYIPIIGKNTSADFIAKQFASANIGKVERVDFVLNKAKDRREAFVHFSEWFQSDSATQLNNQLEISRATGEQCHFKYNNGSHYWPLLINKNPMDKDSPDRKSNEVYVVEDRFDTIDDRIKAIEKELEQLTFMKKVHDADIRFILHSLNREEIVAPELKRLKSHDGTSCVM